MQLAAPGSGGTATSPRVSSARRRLARIARSARAAPGGAGASAASASPTRMRIVATLLVSVPAKSAGRPRPARPRPRRDRQRLVDDVDQLQRVLGDVAVLGHDQGDRLADVAHDVARDGRLQVALGAWRARAPGWG